jgi:hypothetical protein
MIFDAYVRQNQPHQRLYWSGPRTRWTNITGLRTLPRLKNRKKDGTVDPRDKTGHIIHPWMVDHEYVAEVMGEDGKDWCNRLFANPTFQPGTESAEPLQVLARPEYIELKDLYESWAEKLVLADTMREQLVTWSGGMIQ